MLIYRLFLGSTQITPPYYRKLGKNSVKKFTTVGEKLITGATYIRLNMTVMSNLQQRNIFWVHASPISIVV